MKTKFCLLEEVSGTNKTFFLLLTLIIYDFFPLELIRETPCPIDLRRIVGVHTNWCFGHESFHVSQSSFIVFSFRIIRSFAFMYFDTHDQFLHGFVGRSDSTSINKLRNNEVVKLFHSIMLLAPHCAEVILVCCFLFSPILSCTAELA